MYKYEDEKKWLFSDEGQRMFLKARDTIKQLIEIAGAFEMFKCTKNISCYNTFEIYAIIDRLLELEEIIELTPPNEWAQNRIFTRKRVN